LSIAPLKPNSSYNPPLECPLCASHAIISLRSHATAPVIQRWRQQYGADVTAYFRDLEVFTEFGCHECGIQFFSPATTAAKPPLYEILTSTNLANGKYYRAQKWEYDMALKDIASPNPNKPNGAQHLLEIGCGFGDFLSLATSRSGNGRLAAEGIEQNPAAVLEARRRGAAVRHGDIREIAAQCAGQYNVVCLFQVLEHVPDPGDFLRAVCTVLQKGGRLILAVPNTTSFLRHAWNILDMPPHHMTRWKPSVMAQLTRLFPLQILRVHNEPLADYHVSDYTEAYLSAWSKRRGLHALSHPRVKSMAVGLIRRSGAQRFLRGHTLYGCFERT